MDKRTALRLAQDVRYKPDWTLEFDEFQFPTSYVQQFFQRDCLGDPSHARYLQFSVAYEGFESDDRNVPRRLRTRGRFSRVWALRYDNLHSAEEFYAAVFSRLMAVEEHEAREAFDVQRRAPYHPHRTDGEIAWRQFGKPALKLADSAATPV